MKKWLLLCQLVACTTLSMSRARNDVTIDVGLDAPIGGSYQITGSLPSCSSIRKA